MITDDERRPNFRHRITLKGRRVEIVALHTVSRRLSNAAAISRNIARGRPALSIEERWQYQWRIIIDGRPADFIRLNAGEVPYVGRQSYPGISISAVGEAVASKFIDDWAAAQVKKEDPTSD